MKTLSVYLTAQEISDLNHPRMPSTADGVHRRAAREKWAFICCPTPAEAHAMSPTAITSNPWVIEQSRREKPIYRVLLDVGFRESAAEYILDSLRDYSQRFYRLDWRLCA